MKHKLLLTLALSGAVFPLTIVGCGGGVLNPPTPQATATPTTMPTMPPTITGQRFVGPITSASGFNGDGSAFDFSELASSNFDFSGNSGVTPTFDNNAPATPR